LYIAEGTAMAATPPVNAKVFEFRSVFKTSMQNMIAFHEHPRALWRMTPPPIFVQQLKDERKSLTSGEIEFRLWLGPIPVRWLARHEPGPTETSFADVMLRGPMAYWRHEHIFTEVSNGIELTDRVTLAHKPSLSGMLTRLVFNGLALRGLFIYRHLRTRFGLGRSSRQ
jgi:ligand-binding SRPBCC domain-containing protein